MTTDSALTHHAPHGAPEQQAGGPAHEPLSELEHPTHKGDHDPAHHNDPEAIKKEIKKYLMVFGALAVLTIITVSISQLHLPTTEAIILALAVATVKGSLVAAFFMHLISERKLIYAVLVLTVFFFGMMIWGPSSHHSNAEHQWPGYDINSHKPPPPEHGAAHNSGH